MTESREYFAAIVVSVGIASASTSCRDSQAPTAAPGLQEAAPEQVLPLGRADRVAQREATVPGPPGSFEVEARLSRIIMEQLGVSPEEVTEASHFVDDLDADRLDIVELIMSCEEEFDIEIPDEDVWQLETVGAMQDYVSKRLSTD